MTPYEFAYSNLVQQILEHGDERETRNGKTKSMFGATLRIGGLADGHFPLLQGRRIFTRGVFGELAAILRKPTTTADFAEWGCNYWRDWGDKDGNITVDYGNSWFNFNGFDQIAELKRLLKEDPTSRRILVSGWRPEQLANLSLPCCHLLYQFYVSNDNRLHMIWTQRSADLMVGVPSDAVFAAAWLLAICNEFGFTPGDITMHFGDTHIYEEHFEKAQEYLYETMLIPEQVPLFAYTAEKGKDFTKFEPDDIEILFYEYNNVINFKLKV